MRTTVNSTFISLDGIVQSHGPLARRLTSTARAQEQLNAADALLLGRKTYESYAAVWPSRDDEHANAINALPKYVASTTLTHLDWHNTSVIHGDLIDAVRELTAGGDGTLLMHGYGAVARALLAAGLLDELHLWVHPSSQVRGQPRRHAVPTGPERTPHPVRDTRFDSGVVLLSYNAA
jgi:dihydrofolate reductase